MTKVANLDSTVPMAVGDGNLATTFDAAAECSTKKAWSQPEIASFGTHMTFAKTPSKSETTNSSVVQGAS